MTSPAKQRCLGRFELRNKKSPQKEVTMNRSWSSNKSGVKVTAKQREELLDVLQLNLKEIIKEGVTDYVADGTKFMYEMLMQAEARSRCGKWHEQSKGRQYVRWGTEAGRAVIEGKRTTVTRPRVRVMRNLNTRGGEVRLETYTAMNRAELLDGPLVASILSGVSTRRYLSILSRGLEAKGVSKSAISRKAIAATKPTVEQFRRRSLQDLDLVVLLFDGIHIAKKQMIVCVGIDMNGRKHVLGLHLGATESDIVCRDLIRDMVERGLTTEREYLFVIDGSQALAKAIRAKFGQEAAIQRCQEHKIRDIQAYLPVRQRQELRDKLQAAYNERTEKGALKRLAKIRNELWLVSENAVTALTEGMYETLTVHRLGITGLLRKSLRTTNIIESAFSSVRRYMGRVTKFKDEAHINLWVTRSLIEAERHFRVVPGYRQLGKLRNKLVETQKRQKSSRA
jgi:transposase-like protein